MTAGARQVATESHHALYPRLIVGAIIQVAVAWTQWGQWSRFSGLWAVFLVFSAASIALARFWDRETAVIVLAKFLANVGLVLLTGHLSAWSFPAWFFLSFVALSRDSANFRTLRASFLGTVFVMDAVALMEHANLVVLITSSLVSLATYASAERRMRLSCKILDELADRNAQLTQAHAELKVIHAHAIEREKLLGLGMLAAGVAHEINNPMAFVTSNVDSLLKELQGRSKLDETLAEYANDVLPATLEGIRRVNVIVGDLRRFARGDPAGMVPYDLNEQVRAALRIMDNKIKHTCELEVALEPLPESIGLPQQLVQLIINLLGNAVEAHPENTRGFIRVATAKAGNEVVLRISDRGIGMAPEVRSKLFQPFFTTKPVGQGTGLGLSVVYGITQAHAGTIAVETAPGRGSTFTIRLPVQPGLAKLEAATRLAPAA